VTWCCSMLYDYYGNDNCYDDIVLAIFMASAGEVRRAFRSAFGFTFFFLKKIFHETLHSLLNTTCFLSTFMSMATFYN